MPSADFLRGLTIPTAVIAAERDVIVPSERTAALRQAIANLVLDRTIAGAQHHDIFHHAAFAQAMTDAIMAIEAHPAP
jgi:pimeloyl-ACP methyl ester carboxylesterase